MHGFPHCHDLGGLPTRSGVTAHGAFFRSAAPRPGADWRSARRAGIRTVVDLRNDDEIEPYDAPGMDVVHVPLDDVADVEFWRQVRREGRDGSPLYYPLFLARKPERCAAAIAALAEARPGGVLFHCGLGRDRTGLVALLLLALADVEPAAIVADYLRAARSAVPHQAPLIEAALRHHGTTLAEAVRATLDGLDPAGLLLAGGATSAQLTAIRTRSTHEGRPRRSGSVPRVR
ncbi:tyrosine-protein phosphatase [Amycolatopsis sacchari]|uniref:tyrosine-protein phosphatase n=1 Tax=Amycolatopsis sacchari TaxID=115433 RepID=UPI003D739AB5